MGRYAIITCTLVIGNFNRTCKTFRQKIVPRKALENVCGGVYRYILFLQCKLNRLSHVVEVLPSCRTSITHMRIGLHVWREICTKKREERYLPLLVQLPW